MGMKPTIPCPRNKRLRDGSGAVINPPTSGFIIPE